MIVYTKIFILVLCGKKYVLGSIYIAFKITNKKIALLKFDETHTSSFLCWVIMLIYMQKYTLSTEI